MTSHAASNQIATAFKRHAQSRGPKYLSLHAALNDLVMHGSLASGSQLPPDDDIAAHLGLSLGTVQKAMAALRDDGLVERRQGFGTFVRDQALGDHDVWHFRFLNDTGDGYLPLSARAISIRDIPPGAAWSDHMPDVSRFIGVTRRIDVDDAFSILSDFYFDGDRFARLEALPRIEFDRVVLRNLLLDHFNVRTVTARQLLSCMPLAKSDTDLIGGQPGATGMILETFGVDADDQPIYYQRVVIPQTERKLVLDPSA